MSSSPVDSRKKSSRARRESRRVTESYDRVVAAANVGKNSVTKATRSIPDEPGFNALSINEGKRDIREASRGKSSALFSGDLERNDKPLAAQHSLRPLCKPNSTMSTKYERLRSWIKAPYKVGFDLTKWQEQANSSKLEYDRNVEREQQWLHGFQMARKYLLEASKSTNHANMSLKDTALQLLELCDDQRVVNGKKRRRAVDVEPLAFDTMKNLADIFQGRHASLISKVKDCIEVSEEVFAIQSEIVGREKQQQHESGGKEKGKETPTNTRVHVPLSVTVEELYYPEDSALHSTFKPRETSSKNRDCPMSSDTSSSSGSANGKRKKASSTSSSSSSSSSSSGELRTLTEEEKAIEEAKRTRSESFDFYLNQLSYENENQEKKNDKDAAAKGCKAEDGGGEQRTEGGKEGGDSSSSRNSSRNSDGIVNNRDATGSPVVILSSNIKPEHRDDDDDDKPLEEPSTVGEEGKDSRAVVTSDNTDTTRPPRARRRLGSRGSGADVEVENSANSASSQGKGKGKGKEGDDGEDENDNEEEQEEEEDIEDEDDEDDANHSGFVASADFPTALRNMLINLEVCVARDESALGDVNEFFRLYSASSSAAVTAAAELEAKDREIVVSIHKPELLQKQNTRKDFSKNDLFANIKSESDMAGSPEPTAVLGTSASSDTIGAAAVPIAVAAVESSSMIHPSSINGVAQYGGRMTNIMAGTDGGVSTGSTITTTTSAAGAPNAAIAVSNSVSSSNSNTISEDIASGVAAALDMYLSLKTEKDWVQFASERFGGSAVGGIFRSSETDVLALCSTISNQLQQEENGPGGVLSSVLLRNKRSRGGGNEDDVATTSTTTTTTAAAAAVVSSTSASSSAAAAAGGGGTSTAGSRNGNKSGRNEGVMQQHTINVCVPVTAGLRRQTLYSNHRSLYISPLSQFEDRNLGAMITMPPSGAPAAAMAAVSVGARNISSTTSNSNSNNGLGDIAMMSGKRKLPDPSIIAPVVLDTTATADGGVINQLQSMEADVLERYYLQSRAAALDLKLRRLKQTLTDQSALLHESDIAQQKSQKMFYGASLDELLEQDKILKDLTLYGLSGGPGVEVSQATIDQAVLASRIITQSGLGCATSAGQAGGVSGVHVVDATTDYSSIEGGGGGSGSGNGNVGMKRSGGGNGSGNGNASTRRARSSSRDYSTTTAIPADSTATSSSSSSTATVTTSFSTSATTNGKNGGGSSSSSGSQEHEDENNSTSKSKDGSSSMSSDEQDSKTDKKGDHNTSDDDETKQSGSGGSNNNNNNNRSSSRRASVRNTSGGTGTASSSTGVSFAAPTASSTAARRSSRR